VQPSGAGRAHQDRDPGEGERQRAPLRRIDPLGPARRGHHGDPRRVGVEEEAERGGGDVLERRQADVRDRRLARAGDPAEPHRAPCGDAESTEPAADDEEEEHRDRVPPEERHRQRCAGARRDDGEDRDAPEAGGGEGDEGDRAEGAASVDARVVRGGGLAHAEASRTMATLT
jgi:hypothetical protein